MDVITGVRYLMLFFCTMIFQDGGPHVTHIVAAQDTCQRTDDTDDVTANVGDDISMTCTSDLTSTTEALSWYKDDIVIAEGNSIADDNHTRLSVVSTTDNACLSSHLTIINLESTDAGSYSCRGNYNSGTIQVTVTPFLPMPECSTNITSETVLGVNDSVTLICRTDRTSYSVGSLNWVGMEDAQIHNEESSSTSLVVGASTALESTFRCVSSCNSSANPGCLLSLSEQNRECIIEFISVEPSQQTVTEGGNVTFTCDVKLKGYRVKWFVRAGVNDAITQDSIQSNMNRTETVILYNVTPSILAVICVVSRVGHNGFMCTKSVTLNVVSQLNESSATPANSIETNSMTNIVTTAPKKFVNVSTHLKRSTPDKIATRALSTNLIIAVAVCGAVAAGSLVFVVACLVHRRRKRWKQQTAAINPVLAFGDLNVDSPVNLDVHFNVYGPDDVPEDSVMTPDRFRNQSSKIVKARGHGDEERVTSFYPGNGTVPKRDEDDEPGRKLSFFVENDVYVSYDQYL